MDDEPVTFRVLLEDYAAEARKPCARCGQMLDERDLTQVLHHRAPDHQPLEVA